MTMRRVLSAAVVCLFFGTGMYFFSAFGAGDQPGVVPGVPRDVSKSLAASLSGQNCPAEGWVSAAKENATSVRSLAWKLPSGDQKGWKVYLPLIAHLLNVKANAGSEGFAKAVAVYQERRRCKDKPDGIVDERTLMRMILDFQGIRFKQPRDESGSLVKIPARYFMDPKRPASERKLGKEAWAHLRLMLAAAKKQKVPGLRLISGYRSQERQDEIRDEVGEEQPGASSKIAKKSAHTRAVAVDLDVGGIPVSTKLKNRETQVKNPAYLWLLKHAHCYGFVPFYFEPWHWEYVGVKEASDAGPAGSCG